MGLRLAYSKTLFSNPGIGVVLVNKEKLPAGGRYLLISNHRNIIDPMIIEVAFEGMDISGYWVSKKGAIKFFFSFEHL
jgi:1-acyl-sn-glycerol-3-phosphate acyltransferase